MMAGSGRSCVPIHVPLSPSSVIWYQPKGSDALRLNWGCVFVSMVDIYPEMNSVVLRPFCLPVVLFILVLLVSVLHLLE